ncbi:DUF6445 family protein [Oleiagrimonas sp. C23AA]|uniref:DUF6445 family protein n=1 Tax=Oleiagrimonas sp. C23AA TaxID=2719047 RepID=UPI00142186F4|nr:DUF6445 family protein [Oleiagrimonas sp. C23AA]NII09267.1 hypothetical protein [Oleiagrimonas sp. C23AA]
MPELPWFNPRPQVEKIDLEAGACCYVVDDVLAQPERVREWAITQRAQWQPVDFNAYPGTYLMGPDGLQQAMQSFYLQHIKRHFDARRLQHAHSRYAMVTLAPEQLRPFQWLCHSDDFELGPGLSVQASVLYLFDDASLGGTSFYQPLKPMREIRQLFDDSVRLKGPDFSERYGIEPGFMTDSNAYFQRVGTVAARFNRLVFYDGGMLHSGQIDHPERLSADPAQGRLTYNGFFTCRRNAV